jgi:Basophilic leukemia-expressed protein Bles03
MATSEKPSQITSDYWVYVEAPGRRASSDLYGKWQVFVPKDQVDEAWAVVVDLLVAGRLGPSAKVSTARNNSNSSSGPDMHVIIVYAADWRDVADVRRILRSLRDAGLAQGWVHFKRDRETLSGAYVNRGNRGVSVWNAAPGEEDISTKWVSGKRLVVTDENAAGVIATIEAQDADRSQAST